MGLGPSPIHRRIVSEDGAPRRKGMFLPELAFGDNPAFNLHRHPGWYFGACLTPTAKLRREAVLHQHRYRCNDDG